MTIRDLSETLLNGQTVEIYKLERLGTLSGDRLMSLDFAGADSLSVVADGVADAPIVYLFVDDKKYRTLVVYIQLKEDQ